MQRRIQITVERGIHRRARRRATEQGISLAEYIRRLLIRDLNTERTVIDPFIVFDLGSSGGADIAKNKDALIAEAFAARHTKSGR